MSIFTRFVNAFRRRSVAGVELMQQAGNNYYSWRGKVYESDIVRSCMRPKVKAVGKLVAKHLRESIDKEGNASLQINPSLSMRMLLLEPNPLMTGQELQEKLAAQLILNSNAFALILRDDMGTPTSIYPIAPVAVEAQYSEKGDLLLKFTLANSKIYTFPYSDVIHIRQDFNENDIFGTPIASALTPLLEVVTTTDQGVVNAIKNSSVIRWLLKFSNAMRPGDLKREAQSFAENFLASDTGTGVAAVDAKADAQQINPRDFVPNAAQMDRTTARIYALFNTNSNIVTGTYTENQYNSYFDSEIEPVEIALANEFTRKLFTRRERAFGNRIIFEAGAWDTASLSTKLSLSNMVDRGAMNVNEWRATFNLAPIPGGDVFLRRLDTGAVSADGTEAGNDGEGGDNE